MLLIKPDKGNLFYLACTYHPSSTPTFSIFCFKTTCTRVNQINTMFSLYAGPTKPEQ